VTLTFWLMFPAATPLIGFEPPGCEPYFCAADVALATTGGYTIVSWPAPAAADASADACSAFWTR
jgi:hypothetical protein